MKMRLWVQILVLVLFLGGCSSATRHKVLNTLFDGVPDPEAATHEGLKEQMEGHLKEQEQAKAASAYPKVPEKKRMVVHPPFAERSCDNCHESKFSQKLVEDDIKDLCFACHDDFLAEVETPHYPAEEGMCLECHNPHQAENESLLIRAGQAVCFECHDQDEVLEVEIHEDIGDENCWSCHNPHGE